MAQRKSLSKKSRFEVFKRDSFKCQYCGRSAPDVVLNVDHINPVADGGSNDIMNLITACFDCNSGKKDRKLSDMSAVEKQKVQLDELNEKRIQLEMMLEWRKSLDELGEKELKSALSRWASHVPGWHIKESGAKSMKKAIKKYGLVMILDCIDISAEQYLVFDSKENDFTDGSVQKYFDYITKIAAIKKRDENKPYMKDLYYIRGIIKNRCRYFNPHIAMSLIEGAYEHGASIDVLKRVSSKIDSWTEFQNEFESFIESQKRSAGT